MSKNTSPYSVPEGYFEGLKSRLERIPAEHPLPRERRFPILWTRIRPYVAMAACLALLLAAGAFFLDRKAGLDGTDGISIYEQMMYSDMIPDTDPFLVFGAPSDEEDSFEISDEDIMDYLISSGASAELVAYAGDL